MGHNSCVCVDIRCKRCKRLLMKGMVKSVEIKCPKCGYVQVFDDTKKIQK